MRPILASRSLYIEFLIHLSTCNTKREVLKSLFLRTGLDPAGPLFDVVLEHLSASDAGFVDIIHTDCHRYGIARVTGTVDLFPNCGHSIHSPAVLYYNPKASTLLSIPFFYEGTSKARHFETASLENGLLHRLVRRFSDYCSHHRSYKFYAESVINENAFIGVQCSSKNQFISGNYHGNQRFIMGYATPRNASVYKKTLSLERNNLKKERNELIANVNYEIICIYFCLFFL